MKATTPCYSLAQYMPVHWSWSDTLISLAAVKRCGHAVADVANTCIL